MLLPLGNDLINRYFKYYLLMAISGSYMETKKKFNKRAFISTGMLISMIGLPFSGYMNHITGFDGMTSERHLWMSVHNVLGIFFTFFSVWHIVINRKAVWGYMKKMSTAVMSREAIYAVSLVGFFLLLFIMHASH